MNMKIEIISEISRHYDRATNSAEQEILAGDISIKY